MKKLNGFENHYIKEALNILTAQNEKHVLKAKQDNKRLIYAPGYFNMINKELQEKINDLTLKKYQDK
jgi:hypothetical protein